MNESIRLEFREGNSDKIYNAELTEHGGGYVVNFSYGRRGAGLSTGTKTYNPVPYPEAKNIYDKLVHSKTSKGYKEAGGSVSINKVVDTKVDTGIKPQLLNEVDDLSAEKMISDDRYCMQEKNDGRRKMLSYTGSNVQGVNKKGFEIPVTDDMIKDVQRIKGACIIDGEDMGTHIRLFDLLSYPTMGYQARYEMLKSIIPTCSTLRVVETAWTTAEKQTMYNKLKAESAEGVVFKLKDASYSPGRPASGGAQFKYKFTATASCIVISVHATKSSIGLAVLDDAGNEINVGNVTVYPNQVRPNLDDIVEVKYLYYFENGSLFQPVLLGIRDDVDMLECTINQLKLKQSVENDE